MKKTYLLLLLLIVGLTADAQRKIRLQSRIDTPVINQNITTGSTVYPAYVIRNVGTTVADSIGAGEQIRFVSPTSTFTAPSTLSVTVLTLGQVLKVGDSLRISSATITGGYSVKFDSIKSLYSSGLTLGAKPFTANTQYNWFFAAVGVNTLVGNPTVDSIFYNIDTQKIWINKSPTGMTEIAFENASIKTYPNPAANQLSFDLDIPANDKAIATIVDAAGRTVLVKDLDNSNHKHDLDISTISTGMYMLRLSLGDNITTTKFNVQK